MIIRDVQIYKIVLTIQNFTIIFELEFETTSHRYFRYYLTKKILIEKWLLKTNFHLSKNESQMGLQFRLVLISMLQRKGNYQFQAR